MITVFDGIITPLQNLPTAYQIQDDTIAVLNMYNLSPHWLYFSLSGGIPDIFMPPNYTIEGVSIERLTGMTRLSVGQNKGYIKSILLTKIGFSSNNIVTTGFLQIQGFRKDENWQGAKPLITGSLTPISAQSVSNAISNTGNGAGTSIINANSSTVTDGTVRMDNIGDTIISVAGFIGFANPSVALSIQNNVSTLIQLGEYAGNIATLKQTILNGQVPLLYSDAGNLTSDGNGNLTAVSSTTTTITNNGTLTNNGKLTTQELIGTILNSATPLALNTGDTIATNLGTANILLPAAAVTGIRMQTATAVDGQLFVVINNGLAASTITFAVQGTSHVMGGSSVIINGQAKAIFIYNATLNLWI